MSNTEAVRRYKEHNLEKVRERQRETMRRRRASRPDDVREGKRASRIRHLEESRAKDRAYYEANAEKRREAERLRRAANPEISRQRRIANPEQAAHYNHLRRARKGQVLGIQRFLWWDVCAICRRDLDSTPWPHANAVTVGHEPPLSRALGLLVVERPEHWRCNRSKGKRLDSEMAVAQRV